MSPKDEGTIVSSELAPRSYPAAMLLPFFPEPTGTQRYTTSLNGVEFKIYVEGDEETLATPCDRQILTVLAAALARQINADVTSRHLHIETRELIKALGGERAGHGEDYTRLRQKLTRLMATVIETSEQIGPSMRRNTRFRWIDSFQYEGVDGMLSKQTSSVRITLSEEAFAMMAGELGFNTSQETFLSLTSSPSSTWRIYEICLATLLRNSAQSSRISMEELHARIPLQCPLKVFKSRALKRALEAISTHPEMRRRLRLELQRKTESGYEPISFSKRVSPNQVYISIRPVDISDITTDRLIEADQTPCSRSAP